MNKDKLRYITVRALRCFLALALFVTISSLSNFMSYFIAQRTTQEVSEDVIRVIHIILSVLAYNSFVSASVITDAAARKLYFDSESTKINFMLKSADCRITLVITALFFLIFPNAFAVKSLQGWLEIPRWSAYLISAVAFFVTLIVIWIKGLHNWKKTEEKIRKEKRGRNEVTLLIKHIVSAVFAYPMMAYLLPIFFPTLATLPKVAFTVGVIILPIVLGLVLFFFSFDYVRAFFVRRKFFNKLKKSAAKNGYTVSKISHPYSSIFVDREESNFTVNARGKTYTCKLIAGVHYGFPMYFSEDGKGTIIWHITLKYRSLRAAPFAKNGMIWQSLPDDLAQIHTDFTYNFDGDGKKVLIISPTPHSIFATGYGQNRPLDVNDSVWGYTIMTGTAFINALERDAVK